MDPKKFITEMLNLIHDLATATHAGEQTAIAERAETLKAQLDDSFPEEHPLEGE